MPKSAFPLSRTRSWRLGFKWSWRVDVLDVDGHECRLLTAFEPSKEGFEACLTLLRDGAHVVVARLEYHGAEPGWHCHVSCDDLASLPAGIVKPYGIKRLPHPTARHRRVTYEMTEMSALSTSFGFFRVNEASPMGALL